MCTFAPIFILLFYFFRSLLLSELATVCINGECILWMNSNNHNENNLLFLFVKLYKMRCRRDIEWSHKLVERKNIRNRFTFFAIKLFIFQTHKKQKMLQEEWIWITRKWEKTNSNGTFSSKRIYAVVVECERRRKKKNANMKSHLHLILYSIRRRMAKRIQIKWIVNGQ